MAKAVIPIPLRQYAGNKDSVELSGATVPGIAGGLSGD